MSWHVKVSFNDAKKSPFEVNNTVEVNIVDGICKISIDDGGSYKIPMALISMVYEGPNKPDIKEKKEKDFQQLLTSIHPQIPPVTVKPKTPIPE
jgi:hypothetical protein